MSDDAKVVSVANVVNVSMAYGDFVRACCDMSREIYGNEKFCYHFSTLIEQCGGSCERFADALENMGVSISYGGGNDN